MIVLLCTCICVHVMHNALLHSNVCVFITMLAITAIIAIKTSWMIASSYMTCNTAFVGMLPARE